MSGFLCRAAAADPAVIRKCEPMTVQLFSLIGMLIIVIFLLCLISLTYAFHELFDEWAIGVPLGALVAVMMFNLYRLNMLTLSKNTLPTKNVNPPRGVIFYIRLVILAILAILVSKPLETWQFEDKLAPEVEKYKLELLGKYDRICSDYYGKEVTLLQAEKASLIRLNISPGRVQAIDNQIATLELKHDTGIARMQALLTDSNFLVRKIIIMGRTQPACWLLTTLMIVIFSLPVILKRQLVKITSYYDKQGLDDTTLILSHYGEFKKEYARIMTGIAKKPKSFYEKHEDPPFNTSLKKRDIKPKGTLISWLETPA